MTPTELIAHGARFLMEMGAEQATMDNGTALLVVANGDLREALKRFLAEWEQTAVDTWLDSDEG